MDAFHRGAVHEDLPQRLRLRRLLDRARVALEGAVCFLAAVPRPVQGSLEEVGAQGDEDEFEIAPDDAVLVEVRLLVELRLNGSDDLAAARLRLLLTLRKIGRAHV